MLPPGPPPQQRAPEDGSGTPEAQPWGVLGVPNSPSLSMPAASSGLAGPSASLRMPGVPSNPPQVAHQRLAPLPPDLVLYPQTASRDQGTVSSAPPATVPGLQNAGAAFAFQGMAQVDASCLPLASQSPFLALASASALTTQSRPVPLRPPSPSSLLPQGFPAGKLLAPSAVGFASNGGQPQSGVPNTASATSRPPAQRPTPVSSDSQPRQGSSLPTGAASPHPSAGSAVPGKSSLGTGAPPGGSAAVSPGLPLAAPFSPLPRGGNAFSPSAFATPVASGASLQTAGAASPAPGSSHQPLSPLCPSGETAQVFPRDASSVSPGGMQAPAASAYPAPLSALQSAPNASPSGVPDTPVSSSLSFQTLAKPGGPRPTSPGRAGGEPISSSVSSACPLFPECGGEAPTPTNKQPRQGAASAGSPLPNRLAGALASGELSGGLQRHARPGDGRRAPGGRPSSATPPSPGAGETLAALSTCMKTDLGVSAGAAQLSSEPGSARGLAHPGPALPFLAAAPAALPQVSPEGHFYSAFCRLLYELSLRQVSLVDKRVRILLLIFHWLKQRPEEHQDPSHIFRDRQFERLVLQARAYIHLLSQKPLEHEHLQQLRLLPSLGFSVDHAFLDAVRAYKCSLGAAAVSARPGGGGGPAGATARGTGAGGGALKASQMVQKRRERSVFVELRQAAEAAERAETALRLQGRIEGLGKRLARLKVAEKAAAASAAHEAPRARSRLLEVTAEALQTKAVEAERKEAVEEKDEDADVSDTDRDRKRSLEALGTDTQETDAGGNMLRRGEKLCGQREVKEEDVEMEAIEPEEEAAEAAQTARQQTRRGGETVKIEKGEDGVEVITVCVEDDGGASTNHSDVLLEQALGASIESDVAVETQILPSSASSASESMEHLCAATSEELRRARLHSRLLALLPLQSSVRQAVALHRLLEVAPEPLPPLLHVSVRTARKHRLLREQREQAEEYLERRAQDAQRRQVFLSALLEVHRRNFINFHREALKQVRRVAAAVKRRRACFFGADGEKGVLPEDLGKPDALEDDRGRHCGHHLHPTKCGCPAAAADLAAMKRRERLDALKKHDEAAYLTLLQETKNERLLLLVRQTEEYMRKMGDLIIEQREREGAEIDVDPIDLPASEGKKAAAAPAKGETSMHDQPEETQAQEVAKSEQSEANEGEAAAEEQNKASLSSFLLSKERYYRLTHAKRVHVTELPKCLKGGSLRAYQMEGLNWMASLYTNGLNGILADSMGLGKTVQTVSFLAYLHEVKRARNPFLIVAPLSTIHGNWRSELKKWWPTINLVVYEGTKEYRKQLRSRIVGGLHSRGPGTATALGSSVSDGVAVAASAAKEEEAGRGGGQGTDGKDGARRFVEPYFHALLTTDAVILRDKSFLRKIKWEYLVVDEAHRLKNPNSKLVQTLNTGFHIKRRLALTGTPLQNDIGEVWALLNFLMPSIFNAKLNFEQWLNVPLAAPPTLFGGNSQQDEHLINITEEEKLLIVDRLHKVLRPFLLRREKAEVADELPSKQEEIVWCPLSGVQRYLYKMIEGNPVGQNRMVQLRKICNHPYLFCYSSYTPDESLVRCCGKFAMLDVLLPALKMGNHRVLIFSQMTKLLDILEVYLSLRGHTYLRLDGGTSSEERQKRLTLYNQEGSEYFIFILSTKAGGLGVNLQSADTVIIFDSDWNPQNDEQAQSRAHRIGQKKEVLTLRFISVESIEEQILQRAECKLDRDKLVIQSGMYYGHGQEEVHDPSRDLERTNQVREILRKQRQLDVNLTRALDLQLLKRQIARSPEDMRVFERADCIRRLLHVPGLITSEMLPPCLFSWSKAAERAQEALVSASQKKEAEEAWKRVYARSDFWTVREEKSALQPPAPTVDPAPTVAPPVSASAEDASSSSSFVSSAQESSELAGDSQEKVAARKAGDEKGKESVHAGVGGDEAPASCNEQPKQTEELRGSDGEPEAAPESEKKDGETRASSSEDLTEDVRRTHEEATAASALVTRRVCELPLWRATVNGCIREALNAAIACKDFDVFVELPSKEIYKDYFERVKKPICLLSIRSSADKQEFTSLSKLEKYLTRLAVNARLYNGAESPIFLRAVECMGFVVRESRRRLCVAFHTLLDPAEATKISRLLDSFFSFTLGSSEGLDAALLDKSDVLKHAGDEEEDGESSVVSGSRVSSSMGMRVSSPPARQRASFPSATFPSSFPSPHPSAFTSGPGSSASSCVSAFPSSSPPSTFPAASFPAAALTPAPDPGRPSEAPPAYLDAGASTGAESPAASFPAPSPSPRRPLLKIFPMRINLSNQASSTGGGSKAAPSDGAPGEGRRDESLEPLPGSLLPTDRLRVALGASAGGQGADLQRGDLPAARESERTRQVSGAKRGRKRGRPSRKDLEDAQLAKKEAETMHRDGVAGGAPSFPAYSAAAFPAASPFPFPSSFPAAAAPSPPAVGGDLAAPAEEGRERDRSRKEKKKKEKREKSKDEDGSVVGEDGKRRKRGKEARHREGEERLATLSSLPTAVPHASVGGNTFASARAQLGEPVSSFSAPADGAKKFRIRLPQPSFPAAVPLAFPASHSYPATAASPAVGAAVGAGAPSPAYAASFPSAGCYSFPSGQGERATGEKGEGGGALAAGPKFRIRIASQPPQ
ncbi:hypothetical protein NCLIV_067550 [Neospora caninum Liverpool]|uniref:Putative chromatin-remodeling complex ATPase chain n=1 Tax=Neospora caninum (strain Liverpool) TaxID=572307 RepID=F0VRI2_NEOCL|nr:hypothetical protein NCLIV_067550 [Neospora caninum Liverpool]CBZ56330.1 hypothetical protein NCLIV_067550 [Neospora caninum Liverpool]CEL71090.1 TPA: Putative chromatin-remodeling complex ATPase chain [Neospora caninum Liverpool]|eukprot:XP_003886355.1 hypothetical protein NCLIV_067550 [Neospora caninum Liverpool]